MAWTYTGDPGASARDAVRFLIGDTDKEDQLLLDGEILWILGMYNNAPLNAALRCCEFIAAKFSRLADEQVGRVSIKFSQKAKAYLALRTELVNRMASEDMNAYAGGISESDIQLVNANKDRIRPDFTKHMMENEQLAPFISPIDPQDEAALRDTE